MVAALFTLPCFRWTCCCCYHSVPRRPFAALLAAVAVASLCRCCRCHSIALVVARFIVGCAVCIRQSYVVISALVAVALATRLCTVAAVTSSWSPLSYCSKDPSSPAHVVSANLQSLLPLLSLLSLPYAAELIRRCTCINRCCLSPRCSVAAICLLLRAPLLHPFAVSPSPTPSLSLLSRPLLLLVDLLIVVVTSLTSALPFLSLPRCRVIQSPQLLPLLRFAATIVVVAVASIAAACCVVDCCCCVVVLRVAVSFLAASPCRSVAATLAIAPLLRFISVTPLCVAPLLSPCLVHCGVSSPPQK